MVAAAVVVGGSAAAGAVAGVPNLGEVCHRGGLFAVQLFQEGGVHRFAVVAHPAPVEVEGVRQEAFMAGHDVGQVPQALRGVALGSDVDVDSAAPGGVALGPGLAQVPDQPLEEVHIGVGQDRGDHLALLAVRPVNADVLLEFPLAALGIPGGPGHVTVAGGGVLVSAGPEELGGQLGGLAPLDAVHLDLDPDGLLLHLGDLVHQLLVHCVVLRFLCFPFR